LTATTLSHAVWYSRIQEALSTLRAHNEDMTVAAAISFLMVAMFEGRSLREYADMLGCSHSTMSRHLLDLGEQNRKREPGMMLIEQRPDTDDRRKNVYCLTPKGKALVDALDQLFRSAAQ